MVRLVLSGRFGEDRLLFTPGYEEKVLLALGDSSTLGIENLQRADCSA